MTANGFSRKPKLIVAMEDQEFLNQRAQPFSIVNGHSVAFWAALQSGSSSAISIH
jgi:hypothetical protein